MRNQYLSYFLLGSLLLLLSGSGKAEDKPIEIAPGKYSNKSCRIEVTRETLNGPLAIRIEGKGDRMLLFELDPVKGELFRVRGKKEKMPRSISDKPNTYEFRISGKSLKDDTVRFNVAPETSYLESIYATVEEARLKLAHGMKVGVSGSTRTTFDNCENLKREAPSQNETPPD